LYFLFCGKGLIAMPDSIDPFIPGPTHPAAIASKVNPKHDFAPMLAELTESLVLLTVTCEEAFVIACNAADDPLKTFDQLAVGIQMRLLTKTVETPSPCQNRDYLERCSNAAGRILADIRARLVERD